MNECGRWKQLRVCACARARARASERARKLKLFPEMNFGYFVFRSYSPMCSNDSSSDSGSGSVGTVAGGESGGGIC